ncbi:conserved membrane hypothetical protein [Candidatus Terasakiella magnetica]|uniref:Uncharacterized protein n=1 Tax=Candidatus Terasakiella magnetica TaxID=1867952 RepID=A0A1C3RIQ8_9PROT|nr:hypothetical protein [Candidatus Terasakiella magnetica]SCA57148.1 conserved membrane hypothetical protein [Candidatus Terasakiella magnetica]
MSLILIKICVTITIVLGLSVIAERVSPRVAGLLGGYPLGIAIVLVFISYEEGASFAAQSMVHTLAGLCANLSVFATYGLVISLRPKCPVWLAALLSLLSFMIVGLGLSYIDFDLISAVVFIIIVIAICIFSFKRFAEMKIHRAVRLGFWVTFVRAAMACFVVLSITGLANIMGPQMAGVMASFPSTVFPMVVIIHFTYGPAPVLSIIKHFPNGLGAMVSFGIVYALYLESLGLLWGTLASFGAATVYLLAFSLFQQKMRPKTT